MSYWKWFYVQVCILVCGAALVLGMFGQVEIGLGFLGGLGAAVLMDTLHHKAEGTAP